MKVIKLFVFFFSIFLILGSLAIGNNKSPEELIIGKWKEVAWEYEKVTDGSKDELEMNEDYRDEIYKNLIIHKAEIWEFKKNGKLFLHSDKKNEDLRWSIKGRGHILELKHIDNRKEDFQIEEISKDKLVLYFYFDLQLRGIIKITFEKIK